MSQKITRKSTIEEKAEYLREKINGFVERNGYEPDKSIPTERQLEILIKASRNDAGTKTSEQSLLDRIASDIYNPISSAQAKAIRAGQIKLYEEARGKETEGEAAAPKPMTVGQIRFNREALEKHREKVAERYGELKKEGKSTFEAKQEIGREFYGSD